MMPTFPRSPLSFRTAGFPQYGWKAGFPSGAFPDRRQLKPAPCIRRPTSGLHPPFVGAVAELVGIEGGVVSGVINLESSDVGASDRRPHHEEHYHECLIPRSLSPIRLCIFSTIGSIR